MEINKKVSYLKGLAEGLDISASTNEGKLLLAIIETLDDIAAVVSDNCDALNDIFEELEDLSVVVDEMTEGEVLDYDGSEFETGEDGVFRYDLKCPNCEGELDIGIDEIRQGHMVCPTCNQELELSSDCSGCGGVDSDHEHGDCCH